MDAFEEGASPQPQGWNFSSRDPIEETAVTIARAPNEVEGRFARPKNLEVRIFKADSRVEGEGSSSIVIDTTGPRRQRA